MHSTLKTILSDAATVPSRRTTISIARPVFSSWRENLRALISAVAVLAVSFWLKDPLHAEEGGSGDYIPGLYASVVNITPNQPGLRWGVPFCFIPEVREVTPLCLSAGY
jgi:hypothetical protein